LQRICKLIIRLRHLQQTLKSFCHLAQVPLIIGSSMLTMWTLQIAAMVRYTSGLLLLLVIGLGLHRVAVRNTIPVPVERVGPAPVNSRAYYPVAGQHHGNTVYAYEDLGGTQPWHIWIRYSNCPATSTGALRLTVYKASAAKNPPGRIGAYPSPSETLYSQTMTDYRTSDSATFAFPGQPETFFKVRIDVPNHLGCEEWRFGSEGN